MKSGSPAGAWDSSSAALGFAATLGARLCVDFMSAQVPLIERRRQGFAPRLRGISSGRNRETKLILDAGDADQGRRVERPGGGAVNRFAELLAAGEADGHRVDVGIRQSVAQRGSGQALGKAFAQ